MISGLRLSAIIWEAIAELRADRGDSKGARAALVKHTSLKNAVNALEGRKTDDT